MYNENTSHNTPRRIDHWHNEPTRAKTYINSLYVSTEACTSTKHLVCTTMECTRRSCVWYLEATEPTLLNYSFALVLGLHMLKYPHAHRAYNHISSIHHTARTHAHTPVTVWQLRCWTHFSCISLRSSFPAVWKDIAGSCPQFVPEKFITQVSVRTRHMFVDAFTRALSYAVRIYRYEKNSRFVWPCITDVGEERTNR